MNTLAPAEFFKLALEPFMRDLRAAANASRLQSVLLRPYSAAGLSYLKGRLHGCAFGCMGQIIHTESMAAYDECEMLAYSLMAEADFLCGEYQFESNITNEAERAIA